MATSLNAPAPASATLPSASHAREGVIDLCFEKSKRTVLLVTFCADNDLEQAALVYTQLFEPLSRLITSRTSSLIARCA